MIRRLPALGAPLLLAAALSPLNGSAQIAAAGSTKLSLSGSGFVGSDFTNMTNILGLSRFSRSGLEIGGDIMLAMSRTAGAPSYDFDPVTGEMYETGGGESELTTTGFMFGRIAYNFIGESTTVPFVSVGLGAPISDAETIPILIDIGGGIKKFISERASFDIMANYQGQSVDGEISWQDGLSLYYGLSFYLGGGR